MPFGEYIPLESVIRGLIPFFDLPMSSFRAGEIDQDLLAVTVHQGDSTELLSRPYICYEIAYPDLVLETAKNADLLVTISNDAWFGDSLDPQHMALALVRALETGRWILRSTNTGISALVNHKGEITDRIPVSERTSFSSIAERRTGETLYMKIGVLPLLCFAFTLIALATLIQRKGRGETAL